MLYKHVNQQTLCMGCSASVETVNYQYKPDKFSDASEVTMGKIVVEKIKGMNLWAKFALVTLCTLLVSAFMYESTFALSLPVMHNSSSTGKGGTSGKIQSACTGQYGFSGIFIFFPADYNRSKP